MTTADNGLRITPVAGGVRFNVHVQPKAKQPGADGLHGDALKLRVAAPPVDGAANDAVAETLADLLGVPTRAVSIVAGASSRAKVVEVAGVTVDAVRALVRGSGR